MPSGAGSEITALAESLQAYACSARQSRGRDLTTITEITSSNTKDAKCDRSLDKCLKGLDDIWKRSCIETANQIFKDYRISNCTFHRGGDVESTIYGAFKKFKAESPFSGEDKWNPADIWIVKKGYKIQKDFKGLNELNAYLFSAFKKKDLIGVSLKKIGPKNHPHKTVYNDGRPPQAKFTKILITQDMTSSKDCYIEFMSESGSGQIQLRNFSSRPEPSSWQGEIKGKSAAGGKIGGGVLIEIARASGVSASMLGLPRDFKPYIDKPTPEVFKKFAMMFKFLSKSAAPLEKLIGQAQTQHKKDKTWWMSKYLSINYAYAIVKSGKADLVTRNIYGYGSSNTAGSSIFVKYSD
jgi:hypothetical protein